MDRARELTTSNSPTRGRWRLPVPAAACVIALALLAGPAPAGAQPAAGSDDIDVLTATREEVRRELDELEHRRAEQLAAIERARAAAGAADEAAERADARVALAEHEVEMARESVAAYAVEAYIRPPAQDSLRVLSLARADDASYASTVIQILTEERRAVVDVLIAKRADADRERDRADAAAARAEDAARQAQQQLAELDRMLAEQQGLAASLDDRLDAALAEAAALEEVDRQMAQELAAQELALRESGPATPPQASPVSTTDERPAPSGPDPQAPRPNPPAPRPPSAPGPAPRPPTAPPSLPPGTVTWADVTKVGGIWVHTSIADNVRGLLNAATAAGFNLDGGGYRDPAGQIATRRANCGHTHYDIYEKPSSHCTPPTARPGRSMHERGLAMDLRSSGSLITSRSNPAFIWLAANASKYGFYNLPSEPWHWSTNGN